jgi:RNA polymerase sigma-70 factor (ECF subfamily)
MTDTARAAAESAARASYGRLVAYLAARTRDVAAAEDALSQALIAALATWPGTGVPDRPDAWLLTAARRALGHVARHRRVQGEAADTMRLIADTAQDHATQSRADMSPETIPDDRLKLLFVCAHPAIDPAMHTPLMLQTVLGLDAARIAAAFVVAPAAMGQRLVRAKAKIRDAGIRFAVPEPADLPARLAPVLQAIYAAFGTAWDGAGESGLAEEAIWLARLTAALLPDEPEALGLLALLLHSHARAPARRDAGCFVPLSAQNPALWSASLAAEAETALARAFPLRRIGRFQLEAAIQSAHAARAHGRAVDWPAIVTLYQGLLVLAPTLGARVAHAAATAEAQNPAAGLALLDAIAGAETYQPWWATRAHLLARLGQQESARGAYAQAMLLSRDPAVRALLRGRMAG